MPAARTQETRTIERADRTGPLPLSSGQQQMWLLHQLAPAGRAYLMTWTLRISGRLDTDALRGAWGALVERHEILRTRYRQTDDVPHQIVDPPRPFALRVVDLADEPAGRRETRAGQIADWERSRPFDLTLEQPLRVTLVRIRPELHLMVVNIHHIACDEDSYRIIAAELEALYTAQTSGVPAALGEPPAQYADFAVRERARTTDAALRPHLDYWRGALDGVTDLALPLDRPRPARPDRRGGLVELTVGAETAEAVHALASAHRATPYMVLLAAYHVMLGRTTGSDDVTVGIPVSTRTPDLDGLLGYTVNTVAVRSRGTAGLPFTDVLARVREGVLDAFDHRFVPFKRVVDAVNPARGLDGNPLFQVAFDMEDAGEEGGFRLPGLLVERIATDVAPDAKFDLTLHTAVAADGRLYARIEFAAAVIDEKTVRAWAAEWEALLATLVGRPHEPIAPGTARPAPPEPVGTESAPDHVPATAVPTGMMHRIWTEVLETDRIGGQDNFFDLGGDSLRAVALAGRLRAEGLEVSATDIFAHQTVEELAEWCARQLSEAGPGGAGLPEAVAPFALLGPEDRAALPTDVVDAYPLTATQLGMIIELRARPDVNTYQDTTSYLIRDGRRPDVEALRRAAQAVVDRHEVLRTSFELNRYSEPLQLVHRSARIDVGSTEHGVLGPGGWRPALEEYAAGERSSPMAITSYPLIRVHAHTAEDTEEWWITITECHPILEGFSFHTMLMEILTGYGEIREGRTPARPEPVPFRYADYVAAEAAARESQEDRDFWRGVVEGRTGTALPSAWQGDRALARERYQHTLDFRDLEADLRRLATGTGTSMKAVLLTAHMKVMSMVAATEDFYTGLVCDARPEVQGADQVLGMYLNTLPFAMPAEAETWGDLVKAVYDGLTAMWPHRVFPMQVIQQEFGPGGRLLDVFFNYLDFRQVDKSLIDEDVTYNDNDNEFALHVFTISGVLKLNTTSHRLSREAAVRLTALYREVLERMSFGPEGDARAACLPPAEREGLVRLDRTAEPVPESRSVAEGFARVLSERPDAIAVRYGSDELSYRQLDALADRTARRLEERGAGPGALVGISALSPGRGPDTVAALLAVMRTGAAFTLATADSPGEGPPVVARPEALAPDVAWVLPGTPGAATGPGTSGTHVSHRALAQALGEYHSELAVRGAVSAPGSSWLCAGPPVTTAHVIGILTALTTGATVVMTSAPLPDAVPEMRRLIAAGEVTHLVTTPLVAERVVVGPPRPFTAILTGDDEAGPALPEALRTRGRVIETLMADGLIAPVAYDGVPPRGTGLDVVDTRRRRVPVGVVGELRVDSAHDDRTVHPACDAAGPRRTGLPARVGTSGRLEPMGPAATHRTRELLGLHPSVLDCRVVEHPHADGGGRQLVGYVRPAPAEEFSPDEIRRALAGRRLPRHLIPDVLVPLEDWPLTAAGTVYLDLLPEPPGTELPAEQPAKPWDDDFDDLLRGVLTDGPQGRGLDPDVPLADAGLSSMATVGLIVAIEQHYDLVIPDDFQIVDMFRTPRMLWEQIREFRAAQA
ncbi:condensation domain-containing protein [Streptomyces sp. NPDC006288]|uniref:condensation domain-containing protein n=1 Tax=Streptomyces sp. NPDC006288 TaxID=3156743 RepID=UPI0033B636FF